MSEPKDKKKRNLRKLLNRYRLVVMNDDTFEERFSLSLTPLRVFVLAGIGAILIILFTTTLIALTPLREYIPGYGDAGVRREMLKVTRRADSLEEASRNKDKFLQNIRNIIAGKTTPTYDNGATKNKPVDYNSIDFSKSSADSVLRSEVDATDKTGVGSWSDGPMNMAGVYFFKPVSGVTTSRFNPAIRHFGVDIAAPGNDPVKSILEGTVISSEWSMESGNTVQIQHAGNMVSIYKHNSVLLKKEGEVVKAGEAIALVGSSGENSTGPHVHFELWFNGTPVNPADYINF